MRKENEVIFDTRASDSKVCIFCFTDSIDWAAHAGNFDICIDKIEMFLNDLCNSFMLH